MDTTNTKMVVGQHHNMHSHRGVSDIEAREKVERCRQIVGVPTHIVAYMTVHVAVF